MVGDERKQKRMKSKRYLLFISYNRTVIFSGTRIKINCILKITKHMFSCFPVNRNRTSLAKHPLKVTWILFYHLCLVCFKETEFQEFSFLIFSCLTTIRKVNQKKVNSGQQINCFYPQESVFISLSKEKHFPLLIKHIFPSLCPKWLGKLPLNFFPIPSLLFHLLVTFKQSHRKTQPNLSQASKP